MLTSCWSTSARGTPALRTRTSWDSVAVDSRVLIPLRYPSGPGSCLSRAPRSGASPHDHPRRLSQALAHDAVPLGERPEALEGRVVGLGVELDGHDHVL